jgi:hypothetical protein
MNSCYITEKEINELDSSNILISNKDPDLFVDTLDCIKSFYDLKNCSNVEAIAEYLEDVSYDDFNIIILKDNKFVAVDITVGDENE